MALSKSDVIKIVLQCIGGSYLQQVPTATIGGRPVACQIGALGGLATTASAVATASAGVESGLAEVSSNPTTPFISQTKQTLTTYSANNFSELDVALPDIASDGALANAYSELKVAIGGSDGLGGAVAQLDAYELHTNRLSGVTLSNDSENSTEEESGTYYDYATLANNNTWETVIQFSAKKYRSAKYFIQGTANNEHQTSELFIIHDNNRVYSREVDVIYTQDPFIQFTAQFQDNVVRVLANTQYQNTNLVVYGIKLEVVTGSESSSTISQEKIIASAKAMRGLYGDDGTDYVQQQAGSLFNTKPITDIDVTIREMIRRLNSNQFRNMSAAQKEAYLLGYANAINTNSRAMQNSIDADIAAFQEVSKKVEVGSLLTTISTNYSDPTIQPLLDLTLKSNVKTQIASSTPVP